MLQTISSTTGHGIFLSVFLSCTFFRVIWSRLSFFMDYGLLNAKFQRVIFACAYLHCCLLFSFVFFEGLLQEDSVIFMKTVKVHSLSCICGFLEWNRSHDLAMSSNLFKFRGQNSKPMVGNLTIGFYIFCLFFLVISNSAIDLSFFVKFPDVFWGKFS